MILTGDEIIANYFNKKIKIDPFNSSNATTNSYDLTLGSHFLRYEDDFSDVRQPTRVQELRIPFGEQIQIDKGDFLLGHSNEALGSDYFVPIIHARSGIARLGLFVHVTADLIDIGSYGQVTFQFYATRKIVLTPGIRIAQVTFWKPMGKISLYNGKYQGSIGPRASQVYQDFLKGL